MNSVQQKSSKDLTYVTVAKPKHPSSVVHDCANSVIDREISLQAAASLAVIRDRGLITGDNTLVSDETQNLLRRNGGMVYYILLLRRCSTPRQPLSPMRMRSSFHLYMKH